MDVFIASSCSVRLFKSHLWPKDNEVERKVNTASKLPIKSFTLHKQHQDRVKNRLDLKLFLSKKPLLLSTILTSQQQGQRLLHNYYRYYFRIVLERERKPQLNVLAARIVERHCHVVQTFEILYPLGTTVCIWKKNTNTIILSMSWIEN